MAARAGLSLGEQCARACARGECLELGQLYFGLRVREWANVPEFSLQRYLRVHNPRVMTLVGGVLWRHCEETHAFVGLRLGASRHQRPGMVFSFLRPVQKSITSIPPTIPISIKMGPGSPKCPILVFNDTPQSQGIFYLLNDFGGNLAEERHRKTKRKHWKSIGETKNKMEKHRECTGDA